MIIKTIQIENLRNLGSVSLQANPVLNYFVGDNGAGKTSILESVVVLSRGRSFRTSQSLELIGPAGTNFRVFAEIEQDDSKCIRLGLERSGKRWKARKNSKDLAQISQLTRSLPLVLMEPDSHLLVSGAPEARRKFLDWAVFHVEPTFLETWRRFSKALRQRNAALRARQLEVVETMDEMLDPLGTQLGQLRAAYTELLAEEVTSIITELSSELNDISINYQSGWGEDTYKESLSKWRERDLERGATSQGPHRADLLMMKGDSLARTVISRGEQKVLSAALLLAQTSVIKSHGEKPVVLLDDLASEFDDSHFDRVLSKFLETGAQVWLTGTRGTQYSCEHTVFHVEHGTIHKML